MDGEGTRRRIRVHGGGFSISSLMVRTFSGDWE